MDQIMWYVDNKYVYSTKDITIQYQITPLHVAVVLGFSDIIKILLQRGADIDYLDKV